MGLILDYLLKKLITLGPLKIGIVGVAASFITFLAAISLPTTPKTLTVQNPENGQLGQVLAAKSSEGLSFDVIVPAAFGEKVVFNKEVEVKGTVISENIINSITAGSGISVSSGQKPTIANTGVISLQNKTGALSLTAGTGVSIDGLKITNSGITSLTAGTGISVSSSTITNSDLECV